MSVKYPEAVQAVRFAIALAETIRELREVREGTLYATCCGHLSINSFNSIIDLLVHTKLVKRGPGFNLIWIGPEVA